jgi:uncharacterized membrane protein
MESKAKFLGHPIHPLLIPFPLGLFLTGVIFDIIYLATGNATMAIVAFWMLVAGIVGGLVAAPFGWIDWHAIPPNTRAKTVGLMHGVGNVVVVLLFIISVWRRWGAVERPDTWAHLFAFIGAGLLGLTGWLGGELVDRLGVGVHDGAHLDAPSSLSNKPLR